VNQTTGAYAISPNAAAIEASTKNTSLRFTVTVSDGQHTTSKTLTVDLLHSPPTETNGDDRLMGSAKADRFNALGGNDFINGAAGDDLINGATGNDTIVGGAGHDTLIGGGGHDRFMFDTAFGRDNSDVVRDFQSGVDKLVIARKLIALDHNHLWVGSSPSTSTVGDFNLKIVTSGNGFAAGDSNDYFIYNTHTDKLYYDDDGNGAHAAVAVATIVMAGNGAPSFADFLLT